MATVRDKTDAGMEGFLKGGPIARWEAKRWRRLALTMLVAVILLAVAAVIVHPTEKVLWMYVDLPKPTVLPA